MARSRVDEWLTPADVAGRLACSTDTVLRAIHRGDLAAVQYGRLVRVQRTEFDRFLADHTTGVKRGARGRP